MRNVHRLAAVLAILVISFALIAPAVASAGISASVPVCCRAHGRHQCSMNLDPHHAERGVRAACPYSDSQVSGLAHSGSVWLAPNYEASASGLLWKNIQQGQTEAGYRISFSRSRQKRGPPSFSI